jgi:hypothetical protein
MLKLLKRCTETAVKLPFAMAWDVISLGNMGDGASTTKILREHEAKKQADDIVEVVKLLKEMSK